MDIFLNSGGEIKLIPGFKYQPLPAARKQPDRKKSKQEKEEKLPVLKPETLAIFERHKDDVFKMMMDGFTIKEMADHMGVSHGIIARLKCHYGFKSEGVVRRKRTLKDTVVERVIELAARGVSYERTEQATGLRYGQIKHIRNKNREAIALKKIKNNEMISGIAIGGDKNESRK